MSLASLALGCTLSLSLRYTYLLDIYIWRRYIPVTICARLFPSIPWVHTSLKPWVHTSFKTVGAHKAKQRTLRVSSKKSWLRSALSTAVEEWLSRRQASRETTVSGGIGCIWGRCNSVRRCMPTARHAHSQIDRVTWRLPSAAQPAVTSTPESITSLTSCRFARAPRHSRH